MVPYRSVPALHKRQADLDKISTHGHRRLSENFWQPELRKGLLSRRDWLLHEVSKTDQLDGPAEHWPFGRALFLSRYTHLANRAHHAGLST